MIRVIIKNQAQEITHQAEFSSQELSEAYVSANAIHFPQNYSVSYTDITAELLSKKEQQEAIQYLKDTDFYIIREMDAGTPCPNDIKAARAAARLKV